MHDVVELERRGVAAVIIVSEPFLELAKRAATDMGWGELSVVTVVHPLTNASEEVVREKGRAAYREIVGRLSRTTVR